MAGVTVDSGELPSARGKDGWQLENVLRQWRNIADGRFEYDCRALLQIINEVDELRLWEYAREGFYKTRNEFLEKVVLIDFDLTEQSFTQIVSRLKGGDSVTLPKLRPHGTNQHSGLDIIINSSSKGGTDPIYIEARLERDGQVELLSKVRSHEISANSAAIQAKYRKPPKPPTPIKMLRSWWKKASDEERSQFLSEVQVLP